MNITISSNTIFVIVSVIVLIFVIRYYSNKINHISQKFDEMRKEDDRIIRRTYKIEEENEEKYEQPERKKKKFKSEDSCRMIFEKIFNKRFEKIRPYFLKNESTEKNMEIDGYNNELKLGFEYQGVQHYKFTPYFHKSENDFEKQKYRDVLKKELCEKEGIKLVYVPYTVTEQDMESYILSKLKEHNIYL